MRNWIVAASRTLRMSRAGSDGFRRRRTTASLETLEHRLSLSSYSAGSVHPADLNPQPLPPGFFHVDPMAVAGTRDLNPQPLPPGIFHVTPMIKGQHVGS
jgi:hypothetical protein